MAPRRARKTHRLFCRPALQYGDDRIANIDGKRHRVVVESSLMQV